MVQTYQIRNWNLQNPEIFTWILPVFAGASDWHSPALRHGNPFSFFALFRRRNWLYSQQEHHAPLGPFHFCLSLDFPLQSVRKQSCNSNPKVSAVHLHASQTSWLFLWSRTHVCLIKCHCTETLILAKFSCFIIKK